MRNRRWGTLCCGVFLGAMLVIFSVLEATALEIAGVDVPQSVIVENKALVLNGAGIRKKFFFKIYVGALYLPAKLNKVDAILAETGPKRITMHFLYKEVSAEDLVKGWNEGFSGNNSAAQVKSLQARIDQFNKLFRTVKEGDVIRLDYLPEKGTQVYINDQQMGMVEGFDFNQAVLKIWLGKKPADDGVKKAWLGK